MEAWRGKEIGIAEGKGILLDLKVTAHGRQMNIYTSMNLILVIMLS